MNPYKRITINIETRKDGFYILRGNRTVEVCKTIAKALQRRTELLTELERRETEEYVRWKSFQC